MMGLEYIYFLNVSNNIYIYIYIIFYKFCKFLFLKTIVIILNIIIRNKIDIFIELSLEVYTF